MIAHRITLDYALGPGWLAPFIEGLQKGDLLGRRCSGCAKVHVPPVRTCDCGETTGSWQPLSGAARIVVETRGADGAFALVQFDGADTQSVVRLAGVADGDTRGKLCPSDGDTPAMVLGPEPEAAE